MAKTIALLTDFGMDDIYVGVMKAVMAGICPDCQMIDLSHAIPPQNVRRAAFTLLNSYHYFPEETVFLIVVDPGVGSTRRPIAVQSGNYTFIAPDNGVTSYVVNEIGGFQAVELSNELYHLDNVSHTFHGRDIFAPAAAYLASGKVNIAEIGNHLDTIFTLPEPELRIEKGVISGEVVHIDHFGNIISSIGMLHWLEDERLMLQPRFGENSKTLRLTAQDSRVRLQNELIFSISRAYHETERGGLLAQIDSNGYLEVAVNQGNAALKLGVSIGDRVELLWNTGGEL